MKKIVLFAIIVCLAFSAGYLVFMGKEYRTRQEQAQMIVDTVEQLESIGISTDELAEELQKIYAEYGAEYVENAEDAITNAVKKAASDIAESFVDYVANTVSETVKNIFSGT